MSDSMEIKGKYLVIVLIGVLVVVSVVLFSGDETQETVNTRISPSSNGAGIQEGDAAKDFSLETIEGDTVKLSDFRGKYVLFASMATWCTPCQIEAANVKAAQDQGTELVVMQIDVDSRETNADLQRFREEIGSGDWIMGFDDGTISQLYNIRSFDTTVIVGPDGKIVYRDEGWPIKTEELLRLLV